MLEFEVVILKSDTETGKGSWTYIEIPVDIMRRLNHWKKKACRVKGFLDNYKIKEVALLLRKGGIFIMPLNAAMRKAIGKKEGDLLKVKIDKDRQSIPMDEDFINCLRDEPSANSFYIFLPASHKNFYNKWISGAKNDDAKATRIAKVIDAFCRKENFPALVRKRKEDY